MLVTEAEKKNMSEFSAVMLENERLMKKFAKAGDDARVVFITGSGTAAMEATVMNVFDKTSSGNFASNQCPFKGN